MATTQLILQVFILTGVIITGFVASKCNVFNAAAQEGMSKLLVNIASPLMMIGVIRTQITPEMASRTWTLLFISVIFHAVMRLSMGYLGKLIKLEGKRQRIFAMLASFGNTAFIGYPMAIALYGAEGLLYAIPINVGYMLCFWTLGFATLKGEKGIQFKNLLSPGTLTSMYVMLCVAFPILRLPDIVVDVCELVGQLTVPLALLIVGGVLAGADLIAAVRNKLSYFIGFLKLIITPLLAFFVLRLCGFDEKTVIIFTVLMAAPSGSMVTIMANLFNCEPVFAAVTTSLTTILYTCTMPILLLIIL